MKSIRNLLLGLSVIPFAASGAFAQPKNRDTKKDPPVPTVEQLLKETKPAAGFTATVFATPDQANYPVFVSAAADGTIYVSSDQNGSLARDKHMGRIIRLRDTKGTGRADDVKMFVKDVDSPRGLAWDVDRLYCLHPPHLSVYFDKEGKGEATEEKILVKNCGFTFKDRPADHTSNGITLGLDGWLYAAIGDFGFMEAEGTDGRKLQLRGGGVVRVRTDGTGLELFSYGTRNILQVVVSPLLDGFARDNTNDGDGWDVRFHHISGFENHGYPRFYKNFADEEVTPLADYGGGAGCGSVWIDDPRWPKAWNNRPFTSDWGRGEIYAHPVEKSGSTFVEKGKPPVFLRLPRPTDIDTDASGYAYATSWRAGMFKYDGPNVGYIARIAPKDLKSEPLPDFAKMDHTALAKLMLATPVYKIRLECQRRLLKLPTDGKVDEMIRAAVAKVELGLPARVAALAYGQQKPKCAEFLMAVARTQPDMAALAIRFLGENSETDRGTAREVVALCLNSADPRTRLEGVIAATRLSLTGEMISKLLVDSDALIAHTTVQCLAKLNAAEACFAVLDNSGVTKQAHVMAARALAMMHTKEVVAGLTERLQKETVPDRRQDILTALCRLYHTEAVWKGESWGTRPDFRGPYYAPVAWEATPAIAAALEGDLAKADAEESVFLAETMAKNRVKLGDPIGRLIEIAKRDPKSLPILVEQLAKSDEVPAAALEVLVSASQQKAIAGKAVGPLVRINSEAAYKAALNAAEADAAGRAALLASPYRDQYVPLFAEAAHRGSALAYAVLLRVAASAVSAVEGKEHADQIVGDDWKDAQKRGAILAGAVLGKDKSLAREIVAVSELGTPEAEPAKAALKELNLDPARVKAVFEAKGPKIKEMKLEEALSAAEKSKGEIWRGEQLFNAARCATCHTVSPDQVSKGPYLGNIAKTYKRPYLAESVLMPSKVIAQGFQTNIFLMEDGKTYTGYVTREAADKVTIRDDKGAEIVLNKKAIETRKKSEVSVMPEGLVADLKVVDLASILDYLEDLAKHEGAVSPKKKK